MTSPDNICPICGQETEDMRHVDVECFYEVNEHAPHLYEKPILLEVEPDKTYFAQLRRYAGGEKQKWHSEPGDQPNSTNLTTTWEPLENPAITLMEKRVYGTRCCKSCRGDFIGLFVRWSKGEFATPDEPPSPERNIPVRQNGALVWLTLAEWEARHPGREPVTFERGQQ